MRSNVRIFGAFAWIGVQTLFWVALFLAGLLVLEDKVFGSRLWVSEADELLNLEQLRLYAQLLTAIFSIYFASIGIILSAGYSRFRRDIIRMLTEEQVGSFYSRILVFAAMFCLLATAMPLFGFEPGPYVFLTGSFLTVLGALALFPLGQRLFNFFDLVLIARLEVIPTIVRHIKGAGCRRASRSIANHHSRMAMQALEQLGYINDRLVADNEHLEENIPVLASNYTSLLVHYLGHKRRIHKDSYWFPRRLKHREWFLVGDSTTSMALRTSSQQPLVSEEPDYDWFEMELQGKLKGHLERALDLNEYDLALSLLHQLSTRISAYAEQFQFGLGMGELESIRQLIEKDFAHSAQSENEDTDTKKVALADTWAALGSNLCLETLRQILIFEDELNRFFAADDWSERALERLPSYLRVEIEFIVRRVEFEREIEGRRLSKPKYLRQLTVQALLRQYVEVVPMVLEFYKTTVPEFVEKLSDLKLSRAATQVLLASLHSHWKIPRWFADISMLFERYASFAHYADVQLAFPELDLDEMATQIGATRDAAIESLSCGSMVGHIFAAKHDDELPDHFGQVYFELAEACVEALKQSDSERFGKIFPMFMSLSVMASDAKFADPSLEINDEFRLQLVSTVINDLASVLGLSILYGRYFGDDDLAEGALAKFQEWVDKLPEKDDYLKRMVKLANLPWLLFSASPRSFIRTHWRSDFESRAHADGYSSEKGYSSGPSHPDALVREYLASSADASHFFFAVHILPQIPDFEGDVGHQIRDVAGHLNRERDENSQS